MDLFVFMCGKCGYFIILPINTLGLGMYIRNLIHWIQPLNLRWDWILGKHIRHFDWIEVVCLVSIDCMGLYPSYVYWDSISKWRGGKKILKFDKHCEIDDWYLQIKGLVAFINFPCVRRGRLGECTIRLGYMSFLTTITFMRVGRAWGPTSGIKVKVTGSNPRGVAERRLLVDRRVDNVHQLPLCSLWALGWMHYKARVYVFPNSNCF